VRTCFECGAPADHEHHVVPRSKGGTKTVPLCAACHGKVHGRRFGTRELTKDALKAKRAKGEKTGGGIPFGFDLVDGRLKENPREQLVIRLMKSLRDRGYSYAKIAKHLNANGLLTKTGREWLAPMVRKVYLRAIAEAPGTANTRGDNVATTTKSPRKIGSLSSFTDRHDVATTMTTT
jgi:hypothetical protein